MTPPLSQPLKWAVLAVVSGVTVIGILTIGPPPRSLSGYPVIDVDSEDAEMNAAIARARGTLSTFWTSFGAPTQAETGHSLKVSFPAGDRVELIWVADIKKLPNGSYLGRLANDPRDVRGKRAGDPVEFTQADISDWMFMRRGKIVGGETIKPLLKSIPKADADALRARMEQP
ncbi:YegJ family protein [Bradyrhizobium sp.]|uniref:YegJ family protein n=1 Tax=Bradyrhizobium sp. TaxID=376 RepID=UPI0039E29E0B